MLNIAFADYIKARDSIILNCLKASCWIFLFMTLGRGINLVAWVQQANSIEGADLAKLLGQGARFDLLVLGYFLIPILFSSSIPFWAGSLFHKTSVKLYLLLLQIFVSAAFLMDFPHLLMSGQRLSMPKVHDWDLIVFYIQILGISRYLLLTFGTIGVTIFVLGKIHKSTYITTNKIQIGRNALVKGLVLIWPFFLVLLMARGTLMPHHLAREHSEITANSQINELVLNPIWSLFQ